MQGCPTSNQPVSPSAEGRPACRGSRRVLHDIAGVDAVHRGKIRNSPLPKGLAFQSDHTMPGIVRAYSIRWLHHTLQSSELVAVPPSVLPLTRFGDPLS
jgi:hypothetical protein